MKFKTILAVAAACSVAQVSFAQGKMRITEWMYKGVAPGGEYAEFTNVGNAPVDMTAWSFDDDHEIAGTVDLTPFGIVQPGQSVILTEIHATDFATFWNLPPSVVIIGDNTHNLGSNDEINLYDASQTLVDRLTYGSTAFPGSISTLADSGNIVCDDYLGQNDVFKWELSVVGDAHGSISNTNGETGNPGTFNPHPCLPPPVTYCTAKVNSLGCTPAINFVGTPSATAGSGFLIGASNEINNKNGLLFYSTISANGAPFQGGVLCVKSPIKRTSVQNSHGNAPPNDCSGAYSFDFNTYITSGADAALISGAQVWAQYWGRDPSDPFTTSLSDALAFTIGS